MFSTLLKKTPAVGAVFAALVTAVLAGSLLAACSQPTDPPYFIPVYAQQPTITAQPQSGVWDVGNEETFTLTVVTADVTDGGALSCQWYSNTTNSNSGGAEITGAITKTLIISKSDSLTNGNYYFYVVVTNTTAAGSASTTSNAATVTVDGVGGVYLNAQKPVIETQPASTFWNVFTTAGGVKLTVEVNVTDGGTLSYQWYKNDANSVIDGIAIPGAVNHEFTLTKTACTANGTYYFYVIVTNTNNNVTGIKSVSVTSNAAAVTVVGYPDTDYSNIHTMPSNLIGEWESEWGEIYTISAGEFSSGMDFGEGWSGYKGTIVNHRGNSAGTAGYITIQYTQNDWDDDAENKYYVIYYKDLTATTVTITGAGSFTFTDPDFGIGGGRSTRDEAEATYTVSAGYFAMGSDLTKAEAALPPDIAATPSISAQPAAAINWDVSADTTKPLTVTASVTDGGTLSYQWYSNTANTNSGGTAIAAGGTGAALSLAKANYATNGVYYFYVVVTNTNDNATTTKTATKTSNAAAVTVIGNVVVIPANITGFFQTEIASYQMSYYVPSTSSFYFDGFAINADTKKFYYYMDTTLETYWGGTIVSLTPQDDTKPAVLIIKVEEVVGSFYTPPETNKYFAYAYKNPAGGIVSTAAAYSTSLGAKNTGVATIAEAVREYTAANGYYEYFGTYLLRPVSASAFGGVKGKWEMEDLEDYFIVIRGTTFTEFYDDYEDGSIGIYDPDDEYDMLASIGTIVDCTDTSQASGILYIKVINSDVYTIGSYIAVAWKNKTGSSIDFATGNYSKPTLAEIKTTYNNVSAFPDASFHSYEK